MNKKKVATESRRRKRGKVDSGAGLMRLEMLSHDMLTKEEEFSLGEKVQRANKMQAKMTDMIDLKKAKASKSSRYDYREGPIDESTLLARVEANYDENDQIDWNEFNNLRVFGLGEGLLEDEEILANGEEDDRLMLQEKGHIQNLLQVPLHDRDILDDSLLTDSEIDQLQVTRHELRQILLDGVWARDQLVTRNIRLVVSIAKKWSKQTAKYSNADSSTRLVNVYNGSWTRPSLDEAIQEGILGLARAASRFEPERGLKFSTYATYWVQSYVRSCFQRSVTGCVKVPLPFHDIKSKFKAIVKRCYESGEELPEEHELADEIGITTNRLKNAMRFTKPLLSLDAPQYLGPSKGSQAGEASMAELLLGETLQSEERRPEDAVELSLLRQCLENAMATELSPHERDVVRLRLGLDDGVTRTAQEVSDVCGGAVSVHAVRAAEQRAYKKLRSPYAVHTRQLMSYLDFAGVDITTISAFKM
jgi:RNA polymerase primary sigma factor